MSEDVSIKTMYWKKFSPKEIFQLFLDNGWKPGYDDHVFYANVEDDFGDEQRVNMKDFSLKNFINSHDKDDLVRIDLRKNEFYGIFHFYDDSLTILLEDVRYLDDDWPPDFSWYLKQLEFFFAYAGVRRYTCEVA